MNWNHSPAFSRKALAWFSAVMLVSVTVLQPGASSAAVLTDGNSAASIDFNSAAGMNSWSVDGQNQLAQQWFWYRVGGVLQTPINTIGAPALTPLGLNGISATYTSPQFTLQISYLLTGGLAGSGQADILENITVQNTSGAALDFHFYQYSDFNLLGNPAGDTVAISGNPMIGFDYALQTKALTQIAEAINQPVANHAEAAITPATLNALNTVVGLVLSDVTAAGPGDAAWALQWDVSIGAGASFDIFKDKKLSIVPIPEPSILALGALALGAYFLPRRRRS